MINPGKAGPKGALEKDVRPGGRSPHGKGKSKDESSGGKPSSGPPGAEGNNTRRDFVQLPRKNSAKKKRRL